ncbi:11511_t:CDS:1, partial [Entrophospora sp. SA101]
MHLPDGTPKGIKKILEKRDLWIPGLNRICDDCKKRSPVQNFCCA